MPVHVLSAAGCTVAGIRGQSIESFQTCTFNLNNAADPKMRRPQYWCLRNVRISILVLDRWRSRWRCSRQCRALMWRPGWRRPAPRESCQLAGSWPMTRALGWARTRTAAGSCCSMGRCLFSPLLIVVFRGCIVLFVSVQGSINTVCGQCPVAGCLVAVSSRRYQSVCASISMCQHLLLRGAVRTRACCKPSDDC
jgi:hypothetical protein